MILQFDDKNSLSGARLRDPEYLTLVFGTLHSLVIQCREGRDCAPLDLEAVGCTRWEAVLVPDRGSAKELWSSKDVTVEKDTVSFDVQLLTSAAFAHVEGRARADALLLVRGYENSLQSSLRVNVQMPVVLVSNPMAEPRFDAPAAIAARNEAVAAAKDIHDMYDAFDADVSTIRALTERAETAADASAESSSKATAASLSAKGSSDSAAISMARAVSAEDVSVTSAQSAATSATTAATSAELAVSARNTTLEAKDTVLSAKDTVLASASSVTWYGNEVLAAKDAAISAKDAAISAKDDALQVKADTEAIKEESRALLEEVEAKLPQFTEKADATLAESVSRVDAALTSMSTSLETAAGYRDDCETLRNQTSALRDSIITMISIPVGHAYNVGVVEKDNVVYVTFSDPQDNVNDQGAVLAFWERTRILVKAGGFPENENDGTIVLDNLERNKYRDEPYAIDMGVSSNYYFAIFTCTTGGIWNTTDSAPRFQITYASFATIRQLLRSKLPLSTIGLETGGVVDVQISDYFKDQRVRLVDPDYDWATLQDSSRTRAAIFMFEYLISDPETGEFLPFPFDTSELTYAGTVDTMFVSRKAYAVLSEGSYVSLVEGTDWNPGDSVADYETKHDVRVLEKNDTQRTGSGCNVWSQSNLRQFLNAKGRDWFVPQNIFDRLVVPAGTINGQGFMSYFREDFLELIMPVYNRTALNSVPTYQQGAGGGIETTLDTFWLADDSQTIYPSTTPGVGGATFEYWMGRATAAERVMYDMRGTARGWRTRTPYTSITAATCVVDTNGTANWGACKTGFGLLPFFCIA